MLKKILIGTLGTFLLGAVSVSAYNAISETTVVSAEEVQSENLFDQLVEAVVQTQTEEQVQEPAQYGSQEAQGQAFGQGAEQGQGQGQGQGQSTESGGGYRGGRTDWTPGSGNNGVAQTTLHGTLTDVGLASVTLTTDDAQTLTINLDAAALGLTLNPGDGITLGGNWLDEFTFTPMQITLDATGEIIPLNANTNSGGGQGQGQGGGGNGGGGGKGRQS